MALTLGDNFSYQGAKPLDARLTYSTLAAMKAVADATMYEGCLAYCTATGKTYQWKSTNTVDETLGKWREFESGGSGGTSDYNDLDNLPKINNVEVKGNLTTEDLGINIPTKTSELTNDRGFITDDDLPETNGAIDLSKFKAPGTAGQVEGHIYSTDETIVGKWIDGKPIYEIVVSGSLSNLSAGYNNLNLISSDNKNLVYMSGMVKTTWNGNYWETSLPSVQGNYNSGAFKFDLTLRNYTGYFSFLANITQEMLQVFGTLNVVAIFQYTKTTDTV